MHNSSFVPSDLGLGCVGCVGTVYRSVQNPRQGLNFLTGHRPKCTKNPVFPVISLVKQPETPTELRICWFGSLEGHQKSPKGGLGTSNVFAARARSIVRFSVVFQHPDVWPIRDPTISHKKSSKCDSGFQVWLEASLVYCKLQNQSQFLWQYWSPIKVGGLNDTTWPCNIPKGIVTAADSTAVLFCAFLCHV